MRNLKSKRERTLLKVDATAQRKKHRNTGIVLLSVWNHTSIQSPIFYSKTCKISTFIKGPLFLCLLLTLKD